MSSITSPHPQALPASLRSSGSSSSSSSVHEADTVTPQQNLKRPRLLSRKSSGTIIVPREARTEMNDEDEDFDEDDARAMSPRRSSQDLEKMGQEARAHLDAHAKTLQKSLLEIFNRIEAVKEEHDKLDNNNKFLQKYIGDLMSTSKITSTGGSGGGRKR
ncbi:hypothetical protein GLAREA_04504 [Glarea lozoyensis ATCC 20868]|uniref:BZIP transcription factor n=1 Tax=Glarea lozoyensis (strain ATCC 20868 / MF5171) TaxID=1116229 RepID=S3DMH7_GLAL2|nr:uncharacterized protein GLAREA_04504 [Glarea lozoyensis ATCC 20868]EPE27713.1 hypothetical protein GLAREA_04504 [Glarea lozoyensis ATCC 20868]